AAGADREGADPVGDARLLRRNEVREAQVGAAGRLVVLLPEVVPGHEALAARLVAVDLDVVPVCPRRGIQGEYSVRDDPAFAPDASEHCRGLAEELARGVAGERILQDLRIRSGKLPRLEERRPVDVVDELREGIGA